MDQQLPGLLSIRGWLARTSNGRGQRRVQSASNGWFCAGAEHGKKGWTDQSRRKGSTTLKLGLSACSCLLLDEAACISCQCHRGLSHHVYDCEQCA